MQGSELSQELHFSIRSTAYGLKCTKSHLNWKSYEKWLAGIFFFLNVFGVLTSDFALENEKDCVHY